MRQNWCSLFWHSRPRLCACRRRCLYVAHVLRRDAFVAASAFALAATRNKNAQHSSLGGYSIPFVPRQLIRDPPDSRRVPSINQTSFRNYHAPRVSPSIGICKKRRQAAALPHVSRGSFRVQSGTALCLAGATALLISLTHREPTSSLRQPIARRRYSSRGLDLTSSFGSLSR